MQHSKILSLKKGNSFWPYRVCGVCLKSFFLTCHDILFSFPALKLFDFSQILTYPKLKKTLIKNGEYGYLLGTKESKTPHIDILKFFSLFFAFEDF
jgi:hypothetical protein